jgi:hypothetical protein
MSPASSSTDPITTEPLAEPAPPRPYGAFVSYSRHTQTALLLTEELRLRGFSTFRDFDSIQHGHRIESDIEEGLARADVVIFDLTEEALVSEAVVEMEFKPTMRRARSGRPLALAVCRGLGSTPAEVQENTWARLTTPFDATWTMVLPGAADPAVPIDAADGALAAGRALAGVFRPACGPDVGRWNIHVATHGHPSFGPELTVDATNLVGDSERRTGAPEDWSRIWRALCDLERVLAGHGARRGITLTAYAHLTAAVAVGFAFRRTKGLGSVHGVRRRRRLPAERTARARRTDRHRRSRVAERTRHGRRDRSPGARDRARRGARPAGGPAASRAAPGASP